MNREVQVTDELKQQIQLLMSQNRFQEAEGVSLRLIGLEPSSAEHRLRLGMVLAMSGDYDRAALAYQQAIDLHPSLASTYYSLANVQKKTGHIAAAITNLQKAVELEPNWAQALNNLAATLMYAGRGSEAAECYQRLLLLMPGDIEVMLQLAAACGDERVDEAIALYWQVLRQVPAHAGALSALGRLLYDSHRHSELLEYCAHVKRQFPGDPKPYAIEAKVLARRGEWQRAQQILDAQLEQHQPTHDLVTAYALIARPAKANDKVIRLIESLLQQNELPSQQQAELHFNLGRLHDHKGEYDKAFLHFQSANRLKYSGFDLEGLRRLVKEITGTLDRNYFAQQRRVADGVARPLFILGMPRSGTSLIEQILDSHSQVHGGGELYYLNQIAGKITQAGGPYGAAVARLNEDELNRYAGEYLDRIAMLDDSSRYVSDKMPQNFLHLGLIARLFPNARVIHCLRDPVDVCLSCYFQSFNHGHEYSSDLDVLAGYYRLYHELMQHWKAVLDLKFFTVRYEDVVEQPRHVIAALLEFLDLPWEESCLRYYENPRLTVTSSHDQVRQPLYRSSVARWRNYEKHIEPLIAQLQGL